MWTPSGGNILRVSDTKMIVRNSREREHY